MPLKEKGRIDFEEEHVGKCEEAKRANETVCRFSWEKDADAEMKL